MRGPRYLPSQGQAGHACPELLISVRALRESAERILVRAGIADGNQGEQAHLADPSQTDKVDGAQGVVGRDLHLRRGEDRALAPTIQRAAHRVDLGLEGRRHAARYSLTYIGASEQEALQELGRLLLRQLEERFHVSRRGVSQRRETCSRLLVGGEALAVVPERRPLAQLPLGPRQVWRMLEVPPLATSRGRVGHASGGGEGYLQLAADHQQALGGDRLTYGRGQRLRRSHGAKAGQPGLNLTKGQGLVLKHGTDFSGVYRPGHHITYEYFKLTR